eukprot:m.246234 g.246234  ORF g.246234 m.246234 type:complete len:282 (-) comp14942_c0_seq1:124-969(-)
MATVTSVLYPIISALLAAEQGGQQLTWAPTSEKQSAFLKEVFEPSRAEAKKIPEIESKASNKYEEINAFLKAKGFSIQLDPFPEQDLGTASVLKVVLDWQEAGKPQDVFLEGGDSKAYPGVFLKTGVTFEKSPAHPNPIAVIRAKNGDQVLLTVAAEPLTVDALEAKAAAILSSSRPASSMFTGVTFPMVDLDQQPDISWLKGMTSSAGILQQAKQQTKFAMDEIGAVVKSAVAMHVARCLPPPALHINKPFIAIVRRAGLKLPLFAGYIDVDSWRKPTRE